MQAATGNIGNISASHLLVGGELTEEATPAASWALTGSSTDSKIPHLSSRQP